MNYFEKNSELFELFIELPVPKLHNGALLSAHEAGVSRELAPLIVAGTLVGRQILVLNFFFGGGSAEGSAALADACPAT